MKSWKCRFGLHNWGKWILRSGMVTYIDIFGSSLYETVATWQERTCNDCGKLKRKL